MGHIGYISLKTKNIFFFIIKVFLQKLETTKKKKKSVSAVHSEAEMPVLFLCELYPGGSFWISNLRVAPANV